MSWQAFLIIAVSFQQNEAWDTIAEGKVTHGKERLNQDFLYQLIFFNFSKDPVKGSISQRPS